MDVVDLPLWPNAVLWGIKRIPVKCRNVWCQVATINLSGLCGDCQAELLKQ